MAGDYRGVRLATRNSIYRSVFDFWLKVFALSFGMGVVTGIVMAFQFGTNWSVLAERSGPIMGPLLGYEAFTAFILEATFFGVMLLGRDRVSPGVYFFACCMVSLGTMFSSFWILANNSWMRMQLNKRRNFMDTSVVIDSNPASCLPINPSLGSSTRGAATARIAGVLGLW